MGQGRSKVPSISDKDMRTVLALNLREEHLLQLLRLFKEVDVDFVGAWGVNELYKIIQESRVTVRAPIVEAIFFMGCSDDHGSWTYPDFIACLTSFCALSREEVLQLLFIVLDVQRNGYVLREEIISYFNYVPVGCKKPVFPINNNNALEKFRQGKWSSLEFDGLSQLCERYPYISYPAYHTQDMFRTAILGKKFWERFDKARAQIGAGYKGRRVVVPGTKGKTKVDVVYPVRCTMQEMLDYSRRKTAVNGGRRVESQTTGKHSSELTKQRDGQIARCPILTLIRNSRCMYHVPLEAMHKMTSAAQSRRPEFELTAEGGGFDHRKGAASTNTDSQAKTTSSTVDAMQAPNVANLGVGESDSESGSSEGSGSSYGSDEDEEEDEFALDNGGSEEDLDGDQILGMPPEPHLPPPPRGPG